MASKLNRYYTSQFHSLIVFIIMLLDTIKTQTFRENVLNKVFGMYSNIGDIEVMWPRLLTFSFLLHNFCNNPKACCVFD